MNRPENTAIHRSTLSRPMKDAIAWGWLSREDRALDFGCGKGGDVNHLRAEGYTVEGYDKHPPFGWDTLPRGLFDFVSVVYVVNVLDEEIDRRRVLEAAWVCLRPGGSMYVVSRRAEEIERLAGAKGWPRWRDGYWSKCNRGMFQRGHSREDLEALASDLSATSLQRAPTSAYSGLLVSRTG